MKIFITWAKAVKTWSIEDSVASQKFVSINYIFQHLVVHVSEMTFSSDKWWAIMKTPRLAVFSGEVLPIVELPRDEGLVFALVKLLVFTLVESCLRQIEVQLSFHQCLLFFTGFD